jgi:hypothetical protein
MGASVCADEAERYVVRVFCGRRDLPPGPQPPWRECLVFAVARGTFAANPVENDMPYRPRLR